MGELCRTTAYIELLGCCNFYSTGNDEDTFEVKPEILNNDYLDKDILKRFLSKRVFRKGCKITGAEKLNECKREIRVAWMEAKLDASN